jgi:hypothetical protein
MGRRKGHKPGRDNPWRKDPIGKNMTPLRPGTVAPGTVSRRIALPETGSKRADLGWRDDWRQL